MSAIKAGDLVVVVKPSACIGGNHAVGHVFQVRAVLPGRMIAGACHYCGGNHPEDDFINFAEDVVGWYPFQRLRRIPPLSELRYADRYEEEKV